MARTNAPPSSNRPAIALNRLTIQEVHHGMDTAVHRPEPLYFGIKGDYIQQGYDVEVRFHRDRQKKWNGTILEALHGAGWWLARVSYTGSGLEIADLSDFSGTETLDVTVTNPNDPTDTQTVTSPAPVDVYSSE